MNMILLVLSDYERFRNILTSCIHQKYLFIFALQTITKNIIEVFMRNNQRHKL